MSNADSNSSNKLEPTQSPCIGVCAMSEATGLCHGCYRTIDEIGKWWNMTSSQRTKVMSKLARRQSEFINSTKL
jgi:uncharacterized protein